jgi:heme/copper-type cytochrome/quinol oxidase subunit 3
MVRSLDRGGALVSVVAARTSGRTPAFEGATRVAVVAALSATTMLFASLVSAYLVRRSFADWRPLPAVWPAVLMAFAFAAAGGIEVAARGEGRQRRRGFMGLALASALYLVGSLAVIMSVVSGAGGLEMPFNAFVALLLSVHVVHAILGGAFAAWILRAGPEPSDNALLLARLVTHFLTALLCAIVFLLFGLQ